jgi:hypothetical protein
MTAADRYSTPASFRRALTDRLKLAAKESRWTLPQLQRQVAYDRLLERLYLVDAGWIVKGATALLTLCSAERLQEHGIESCRSGERYPPRRQHLHLDHRSGHRVSRRDECPNLVTGLPAPLRILFPLTSGNRQPYRSDSHRDLAMAG